MVIQHNMNAMNANRQLGLVTGSLAKSAGKLSSGYKINRAADDAAGLSISEKMRKQIRGLEQASENIEDGISLCQIADGALNETVDILQRMRELAVQSANGTNSASDRQSIEMEITQLKSEIDRIAETTKFNDAVYPLNAPITYNHIAAEVIDIPVGGNWTGGLLHEKTTTFKTDRSCTYDGKSYNTGDTITVTGLTTNDEEVWIFGASMFTDSKWAGITNAQQLGPLKTSDLQIDNQGYLYYEDNSGNKLYAVYITDPMLVHPGTTSNPDPLQFENKTSADSSVTSGFGRFMTTADLGIQEPVTSTVIQTITKRYYNSNESTSIHAGASASQANKIQVPIVNATCSGLGIADLTVINAKRRPGIDDSTAVAEEKTSKAMVMLDKAIAKASAYRSAFGAVQNRLEHAQKIDDNTAENTQAAESQIRDTDMAAEMVKHSNTSILMQAGQSMLAQANQSNQGVLSLVA